MDVQGLGIFCSYFLHDLLFCNYIENSQCAEIEGLDCKGLLNLGSVVALACSYPRETAYAVRSKVGTSEIP